MSLTDFNGGIGQEVNNRMDVYRNEPQKLQQKAAVSKDLLDLMALQKLKNEKAAAARELSLSMEQDPATIRSQMEREALQMQKQTMGDTVKNVSGAIGTQNAKRQKNLNAVAEKGLAGLRGTSRGGGVNDAANLKVAGMGTGLTNPATVKRAQGGIVGFAEGKKVILSEQQRDQLKKMLPFNASAEIRRIQQLDEDSPAAASALAAIEAAEAASTDTSKAKTPIGRGFNDFMNQLSAPIGSAYTAGTPESKLEAIISEKYGPASALVGSFTEQTDESQQYAKDVISKLRAGELSYENLEKLAITPYDPTNFDLSTMPVLPEQTNSTALDTGLKTDLTADVNTFPSVGPQPQTAPQAKAPVPYIPSDPTTLVDPSYQTELDAAIASATAAQDQTAKMANIDPLEARTIDTAELKPVPAETYLTPQALDARRALIQSSADNFNLDPAAAGASARGAYDAYSGRQEKKDTYDRQVADRQAFIDRQLDPARMAKLKRLETFGGGAKYGRGGIGQGYVEAERRFDDLESKGLATLANLENLGIQTDTELVRQGGISGENAASRTQADKTAARTFAANLIANDQALAIGQQALEQQTNVANQSQLGATDRENFDYTKKIAEFNAKFDMQSINNKQALMKELVRTRTSELRGAIDLANKLSENQNKALSDEYKAKTEIAIKNAELNLKRNENLRTNVIELKKLLAAEKTELRNTAKEILGSNNPATPYGQLQQKLLELAGSETAPEAKEIREVLTQLEQQVIEGLTLMTDGEAVASMIALQRMISAYSMADSGINLFDFNTNDDDVTVKEIFDPNAAKRGQTESRTFN